MSNLDYLNLSTDLRRISVWLQDGRSHLANQFLKTNLEKFGKDQTIFGKKSLEEWFGRIADYQERGWKSAEDALTLSVLLKNRFRD